MVYNLKRIYSGICVFLFLVFFYISKFDLLLLFIFSILITYEIYKNKLYNFKTLPFLIFFIFIFINYERLMSFGNFPITILIILIILFSVYFHYSFIFFNLVLLFFIFSSYHLLYNDRYFFYLIILTSFVNDTSAYFFGNLLKGPKILPGISPKKTWSGTSISSLISFSLLFFFFNFPLIISILVSLLFFFGDIYFSYVKRKNNIKDFSNIIPGHGGILDRIDSFLFPIILVSLSL